MGVSKTDDFIEMLDESVCWLSSEECNRLVQQDPYWPKWNNGWWRMHLLMELGFEDRIPKNTIETLIDSANHTWMDFFPLLESELPKDCDPYRDILCHCALGSLVRLILKTKPVTKLKVDWMDWFKKYQLPDGGWNCDEQAYTKSHKSSLISTVAVLDAYLEYGYQNLSLDDKQVVDKAVSYLLDHQLIYNSKGTNVPVESWKLLMFPRFYELDLLRALSCVVKWSEQSSKEFEIERVAKVLEMLLAMFLKDGFSPAVRKISEEESFSLIQKSEGEWISGKAESFPLLDYVENNPQVSSEVFAKELVMVFKYFDREDKKR
jgi:hypothetical protein